MPDVAAIEVRGLTKSCGDVEVLIAVGLAGETEEVTGLLDVLFPPIFGNETWSPTGACVATFYVPGILALSIISATMINLAFTTVTKRESGILKGVRGNSLGPWVYVAGEIFAALVITALMTVPVAAVFRL